MTNEEIKSCIAVEHAKIGEARWQEAMARVVIQRIQEGCPHTETESWTNDDGCGQFKVERCLICGLQKDHGLRKE
jgi:hypothetical protein